MDDKSISLNAVKIVEKVFTPHGNGYDPEQVDTFLDQVAHDYQAFEKYYTDSHAYIIDLETKLRAAQENIRAIELEKAKLDMRLSGIKEGTTPNQENIAYLQRIRALENKLYSMGIDPSKL